MLPHERLLSRSRPATPEDLEEALHAAVAVGELEEGAGRRLLDLVASMRGSGSASISDTMPGPRSGARPARPR